MDTQLLEAFRAVTNTGSFSRAGEQLHLTQPAVSKRIALLEQTLSCKLFDRIGRNIYLTEAGNALLPRAQQILDAVKDTQRAMGNLNSGDVSGELHVASSHHIGLHHLPPVLRRFLKQYPQVKPNFTFMDSEQAYAAVKQGDIELGIITLAPQQQLDADGDIQSEVNWEDPLAVVCALDHPLATKDKLTITDLSRYPAILPDLQTYTTQLVTTLFASSSLQLDIIMETNYLETIKVMVSVGLGWSVLPKKIIDSSLLSIDISGIDLSRQLGCIYHRERTLSNAAQRFLTLLREEASQDPSSEKDC